LIIVKELIMSFLCTLGFSVLFSLPKGALLYSGFVGAAGWGVFSIISSMFQSNIVGSFFGAITVGILGELLARYSKKPATLYITPGIVPLVPGAGMYYTMVALIQSDFNMALSSGLETFFIATSISIGIIISSTFSRSIIMFKLKD